MKSSWVYCEWFQDWWVGRCSLGCLWVWLRAGWSFLLLSHGWWSRASSNRWVETLAVSVGFNLHQCTLLPSLTTAKLHGCILKGGNKNRAISAMAHAVALVEEDWRSAFSGLASLFFTLATSGFWAGVETATSSFDVEVAEQRFLALFWHASCQATLAQTLTFEGSAAGLYKGTFGSHVWPQTFATQRNKSCFSFVWCLRHSNQKQHACQPSVFANQHSSWWPFFFVGWKKMSPRTFWILCWPDSSRKNDTLELFELLLF